MTTTDPQPQETLEEIAERIVREWVAEWFGPPPDDMQSVDADLAKRVLEALRNERDRAAKIAETQAGMRCMRHQKTSKGVCGYEIAAEIREGR